MSASDVITTIRTTARPLSGDEPTAQPVPGGAGVLAVTVTDEGSFREAWEAYGSLLLTSLHRNGDGATADPDTLGHLHATSRPLSRLSRRESDVLALMAEGLGNTAIAAELCITKGGVHKHIRNVFAKLSLEPDDPADRRVTAVLHYLNGFTPLRSRRSTGAFDGA